MPDPVKIAVLIPSRGRPERLARMIGATHRKESGSNTVCYIVGSDLDDPETTKAAMDMRLAGLPVVPAVAPRPASLSHIVNRLAEKYPADVYVPLGDDTIVLTEGWDAVIADAWREKPDGLWWWCCDNGATGAIVSEKWRAAAEGIFSEYFPFWYTDVWLIEVQRYAEGRVCDRLDIWFKDEAPGTHQMRDLKFWDDFFWNRREERKAEGSKIAERLGWPLVASLDGLDLEKNPDFCADFTEAQRGEQSPPTPQYLAALERARTLMPA
jgi:hypothetical protein